MDGESLWPRLAGLSLVVEACEYDRLHPVLAYEFERITTHARLVGAGVDGLRTFRCSPVRYRDETRPSLPLEGDCTLAGFCDHVGTLELWPEPPEWDVALRKRSRIEPVGLGRARSSSAPTGLPDRVTQHQPLVPGARSTRRGRTAFSSPDNGSAFTSGPPVSSYRASTSLTAAAATATPTARRSSNPGSATSRNAASGATNSRPSTRRGDRRLHRPLA